MYALVYFQILFADKILQKKERVIVRERGERERQAKRNLTEKMERSLKKLAHIE